MQATDVVVSGTTVIGTSRLIVAVADYPVVLELNRRAKAAMACETAVAVVPARPTCSPNRGVGEGRRTRPRLVRRPTGPIAIDDRSDTGKPPVTRRSSSHRLRRRGSCARRCGRQPSGRRVPWRHPEALPQTTGSCARRSKTSSIIARPKVSSRGISTRFGQAQSPLHTLREYA